MAPPSARVVPIFKALDSRALPNYGPISVLIFLLRFFKKIVYNKLFYFISDHNILCDNQYGFRKGCSTQQAVITLVDMTTKSQDTGEMMITLLYDIFNKFNQIPGINH